MKHTTATLGILFFLVFVALPLAGQEDDSDATATDEVPADPEEQQDPPAPRWDMRAELAFTDQSGNRSLQVFTGGFNASHRHREDFRFDVGLESRYGRSDGEMVTRNDRLDVAFDLTPDEAWSPFLFAEGERDPIRQLHLRLNGGGGAKYTAARRPDGSEALSISMALLHSFERRTPQEEPADPDALLTRSLARWSTRIRAGHEVRRGTDVTHRTYYQPVWDDLADYLLRSETGLRFSLTERVAMSMVYQWNRDTSLPADVSPDDRLFRTGLTLRL